MNLQEFINKNKDIANQYLKCGGCDNELLHCGKYEIVKVGIGKGKKSEEGLLCETCKNTDRKLVNLVKISDDNNHVFRYALADIMGEGPEGSEPGTVELTPPVAAAAAPPTTTNNNNKKDDKK